MVVVVCVCVWCVRVRVRVCVCGEGGALAFGPQTPISTYLCRCGLCVRGGVVHPDDLLQRSDRVGHALPHRFPHRLPALGGVRQLRLPPLFSQPDRHRGLRQLPLQ